MKTHIAEYQAYLRGGSGEVTPLIARFNWWRHDPWTINVSFHHGRNCICDDAQTWAIGRELLRDGLTEPVGEGQIRIACGWSGTRVLIGLRPPGVRGALIEFAKKDVESFLRAIFAEVPSGAELSVIPFDAELQAWLA